MSSEIERLRAENAALKAKLEGAFFVSRSLFFFLCFRFSF
jgi:hypothetical protein